MTSTGKITALSESLVNRIAAGECVERPASVVKELVENALDAGARRIDIEISGGGRRLVRVTDDGEGMGPEDLERAPLRHTTSKIRDAEDLARIATLGFRGEALAAVGAVSRMTITSRPRDAGAARDAEDARRIEVRGGKLSAVEPAAGATGTTVEVRELFYNAPARRKFLKSETSERLAVVRCLTRLALSHPEAAFALRSEEKELIAAPAAASLRERIAALFGGALASKLIEAEAGEPGRLHLRALFAPPAESRADRTGIHTWLQGRPFRDASVLAAVRAGYEGLLPARRFPIAFLDLEIDPEEVDVNVHPTKDQVRFRSSGAVWALVSTAAREALAQADLAPRVGVARPPPAVRGDAAQPRPASPEFDLWFGERVAGEKEAATPSAPPPSSPPSPEEKDAGRLGAHRLLGQAYRSYIVVETPEGIRFVDQHALHERMIYEDILSRRRRLLGESQRLLIPETMDLSPEEETVIAEAAEALAGLGFELDSFGPRTILVRAAPQILAGMSASAAVREMLSGLVADGAGEGRLSADALRERVAARLACRAAVKAGEELPREQLEALLEGLALGERADGCAHGRPTSLVLTRAEIERRLGRE